MMIKKEGREEAGMRGGKMQCPFAFVPSIVHLFAHLIHPAPAPPLRLSSVRYFSLQQRARSVVACFLLSSRLRCSLGERDGFKTKTILLDRVCDVRRDASECVARPPRRLMRSTTYTYSKSSAELSLSANHVHVSAQSSLTECLFSILPRRAGKASHVRITVWAEATDKETASAPVIDDKEQLRRGRSSTEPDQVDCVNRPSRFRSD